MTSSLLPPSPNWYCSRASDTSHDGIFAFATKNTVFLLNTKTNPPSSDGSLQGHSERVTGVSFCKAAADQAQQCVTSSDDLTVKLWDIKTKTVLKEHRVHQFKLTAIHWSPLSKDLVISGDEKGAVVCWDLASNDSKLYIPEAVRIFSLTCSPHNASHVAVGYKSSIVLLIDINNKGNILHRLRGHEDEIHSICWSPSPGETLTSNKTSTTSSDDTSWRDNADENSTSSTEDGCLLLTGSKDRTIRVWGTSSGKLLQTLRLPPKGFQRTRDRGDDGGRSSRVWVALYWLPNEDRAFISSSHSGDVVRWDIGGSGKPRWEYFGSPEGGGVNMHMRIVFNIVRGPSPDTFITTSMDRKIICWNSSSRVAEWCLSSLGGFVYRIAASPLDQSRLAIGVGDSMIRVWNTATHGQTCDVTVLWQGIKSKVTTVCWHPTRENCLAFATDEGRVGIYSSLTQSNKPPLLSSTYHRKTVYSLSWGPPCPATQGAQASMLNLYSCGGEGAILQHDPTNMQADAINVSKFIQTTNNIEHMLPQRTDVSWRRDGRAVAMGNEDGSIDVFASPNLLLLCTIHVHHKLVNCLEWYPLSDQVTDQSQAGSQSASQSDESPERFGISDNQLEQRYWLASGSNDPHVHVYDLSSVLGPKEPVPLDTTITSSMCCLSGHTLRVTALSWSPHGDSRLVSASYDGTAQVWDVVKGEPLANYRGHIGRIFTCYWSALDEDTIYTGSDDFTVRRWKIAQCEDKCPPKKKKDALCKTARYQSGDASSKSKKNKKQRQKKDIPAKSPEPLVKETSSEPVVEPVTKGEAIADKSKNNSQREDGKDAPGNQTKVASIEEVGQDKDQESVSERQELVKVVNEMGAAESTYLEEAAEGAKEPSYLKIRKDRGKKKRHKSLFPVSCGLDNRSRPYRQADCVQLATMKYANLNAAANVTEMQDKETTHLGFFSDRKAMYDLFKDEAENHIESGYFDQKHTLGLWKGNILGELEEAKQNGTLSDMMVAMAAIGGPDVWLEVCEAYAQQLEKNDEFLKAANYYVACHQVTKAIQMLMNNRYHREAAAMAIVRLPSKDPLLIEVYRSWAVQLEKEGSFEQAAKCFLAIDQPADAIRLLCKKGDPSSLRASLEVAILAQQETMATRLMARYVNECMLAFDWSEVQEVTTKHSLLQAGQLLLQVHETMVACWVADNVISAAWYEEPLWSPWQQVVSVTEKQVLDSISAWSTHVVNGAPLLHAAITTWAMDHKVEMTDKNKVTSLYQWIDKAKPQGAIQSIAMKQLMIYLADEVILGQLSVHMEDVCQASTHWLQALVVCHNAGEYEVAKRLVMLILPKGKASIDELKRKISDESLKETSQDHKKAALVLSCLEAYYSLTVLYFVWWDFGSRNSNLEQNKSATSENNHKAKARTISNGTVLESLGMTLVCENESSGISQLANVGDNYATRPTSNSDDGAGCDKRNDGDTPKIEDNSGTNEKEQTCHEAIETSEVWSLFRKLQYLSDVLLSEPHAKYAALKNKLSRIQQSVAKLVTKHKANDNPHIFETNSDSEQTDDGVTEGDVADSEGIAETGCTLPTSKFADVNSKSDHLDNAQVLSHQKKSADTSAGSCNVDVTFYGFQSGVSIDKDKESGIESKESVLPDDQLPDTLIELTAAQKAVLKEIDLIPAEIKEHPFPDPFASAKSLIYFSRQAARLCQVKPSVTQMQELCNKVAEWGHRQSYTEQNRHYFSKCLGK